jgi:hypothetical protein
VWLHFGSGELGKQVARWWLPWKIGRIQFGSSGTFAAFSLAL